MVRWIVVRRSAAKPGRTVPRIPERGDAVWIDLNPQTGSEQAGRRPAVVLSPAAYNRKVGLAVLCPITNQVKGYPFEVAVPEGLGVTGVILADQLKSLDWRRRNAAVIARLPEETVAEVAGTISALLLGTSKR